MITLTLLAPRSGNGSACCCGTCRSLDLVPSNRLCDLLSKTSIVTSSVFLGCRANSSSFVERRCVRASSTGPKTRLFRAALLAFLVLARAPFAMVKARELREGRRDECAGSYKFFQVTPRTTPRRDLRSLFDKRGAFFLLPRAVTTFGYIYWRDMRCVCQPFCVNTHEGERLRACTPSPEVRSL
jgi:hypothetical protein